MDMNWISWIVLGAIAGTLAKLLLPGKDPGGCLVTIIIGIVGGVLGGYLAPNYLHIPVNSNSPFSLNNILVATGGAVLLLVIHRIIRGITTK